MERKVKRCGVDSALHCKACNYRHEKISVKIPLIPERKVTVSNVLISLIKISLTITITISPEISLA